MHYQIIPAQELLSIVLKTHPFYDINQEVLGHIQKEQNYLKKMEEDLEKLEAGFDKKIEKCILTMKLFQGEQNDYIQNNGDTPHKLTGRIKERYSDHGSQKYRQARGKISEYEEERQYLMDHQAQSINIQKQKVQEMIKSLDPQIKKTKEFFEWILVNKDFYLSWCHLQQKEEQKQVKMVESQASQSHDERIRQLGKARLNNLEKLAEVEEEKKTYEPQELNDPTRKTVKLVETPVDTGNTVSGENSGTSSIPQQIERFFAIQQELNDAGQKNRKLDQLINIQQGQLDQYKEKMATLDKLETDDGADNHDIIEFQNDFINSLDESVIKLTNQRKNVPAELKNEAIELGEYGIQQISETLRKIQEI